jgi:hypothetical protein
MITAAAAALTGNFEVDSEPQGGHGRVSFVFGHWQLHHMNYVSPSAARGRGTGITDSEGLLRRACQCRPECR